MFFWISDNPDFGGLGDVLRVPRKLDPIESSELDDSFRESFRGLFEAGLVRVKILDREWVREVPSATVVDPTELVERDSFRETIRGLEGFLGGVNRVELDSNNGTIFI